MMEVLDDSDKVGIHVVLLHGCPQSCMQNPVEGLLEVYEDMVEKAFDRVWHAALWATMKKHNIGDNIIRVIKNLYDKATCAVLFNNGIRD